MNPPHPRPLLRFSLLTLLSLITLAGLVSAIVFSPHWHADERLLLAFWCAGLILGASIGRARGSNGILSSSLGAAVGSVLAATLVMKGFVQLPDHADRPAAIYLTFVVGVGCAAALVLAGVFHLASAGWFERIWCSRQLRCWAFIAIGIALGGFIVFQIARPRPWQPRWEIDLGGTWPQDYPNSHLSPRGDYLFTSQSDGRTFRYENVNLRFQFTSRGVVREELPPRSLGLLSIASPNGEQLADHFLSNAYLFDRRNREEDALGWDFENPISHKQFSAMGDRLLVITTTPRIQRLYVVDQTQEKLPRPELFPFAGTLLLDPTGDVLVKLFDATDETGERAAEVVRRRDGQPLGRITGIPTPGITDRFRMSIAPGGEYLSLDNRVWKRTGGNALIMPGQVIGFTSDRRAVVFCELATAEHLQFIPDWLRPLPLVRHWFDGEMSGQLQIVDVETGKTLTNSESFPRMILASCSLQGNVVLGKTFPQAHFRIWKVPPR